MKQTIGRRCTICNHPARPQIDLAIATARFASPVAIARSICGRAG